MQERDEAEIQVELEKLDAVSIQLVDYSRKALGRFLIANDGQELREGLFEFSFFTLAAMQTLQRMSRIVSDGGLVGLGPDRTNKVANEFHSRVSGVANEGWVGIKDLTRGTVMEGYEAYLELGEPEAFAKSIGISGDLRFEGVPLLRRSPLIWPEMQVRYFDKLVSRQLNVIPNDEVWTHPRMAEIQRMVENAGKHDESVQS